MEQHVEQYHDINPNLKNALQAYINKKPETRGALSHDLLWYGADAIAHMVILGASKAIGKEAFTTRQFAAKFRLKRNSTDENNVFQAKRVHIGEQGVYIPFLEDSENGRTNPMVDVQLFTKDYLNLVGFNYSLVQIPKGPKRDLLERKTKWKLADFANKKIQNDGTELVQDLWATSVLRYMKYRDGNYNQPALTPEEKSMAEEFMHYCWPIMEPQGAEKKQQWVIFQDPKVWRGKDPLPFQAFIGNVDQFQAHVDPNHKLEPRDRPIIRDIIIADSRRQLIKELGDMNIF